MDVHKLHIMYDNCIRSKNCYGIGAVSESDPACDLQAVGVLVRV